MAIKWISQGSKPNCLLAAACMAHGLVQAHYDQLAPYYYPNVENINDVLSIINPKFNEVSLVANHVVKYGHRRFIAMDTIPDLSGRGIIIFVFWHRVMGFFPSCHAVAYNNNAIYDSDEPDTAAGMQLNYYLKYKKIQEDTKDMTIYYKPKLNKVIKITKQDIQIIA